MKGYLFAAIVGFGSLSSTTVMAHDLTDPPLAGLQDMFNGCISTGHMYADRFIKASELSASKKYIVGSWNDNDGVDECEDYS